MHSPITTKFKVYSIAVVTLLVFGFLFWEHYHGGVTSHHLLHQKNLPSISNWWSGLFLPVLTFFLVQRIEKRLEKQSTHTKQLDNPIAKILLIFSIGLLLGVLLSVSFENQFKPFLDNVPYVIIVLSFIIPIFYSEFILGFILGMTFTFGAILPTLFIAILAIIGIITYKFIRPLFFILLTKMGIYSTKK